MEHFLAYVEHAAAALRQEEAVLIAGDRKDEANLVRIKRNIFGIAGTVYEAVGKLVPDDGFREEYLKKLEKLRESWRISWEKAKAHGDVEKAVIEEIKLGALAEIRAKFEEECDD